MNNYLDLLQLRTTVSYLGEKSQFGLWESDFFNPTFSDFLKPVFGKTETLVKANGATAAAALAHDDRIGTGNVYHLFRLPEVVEQDFHEKLQDLEVVEALNKNLGSKEAAIEFLKSKANKAELSDSVGPILVGNIDELTDSKSVSAISTIYLGGFEKEAPAFPYFKGN
ncbi:BrxE family protein [bacterium]|nr:BrxE family protein [bacterium]